MLAVTLTDVCRSSACACECDFYEWRDGVEKCVDGWVLLVIGGGGGMEIMK